MTPFMYKYVNIYVCIYINCEVQYIKSIEKGKPEKCYPDFYYRKFKTNYAKDPHIMSILSFPRYFWHGAYLT